MSSRAFSAWRPARKRRSAPVGGPSRSIDESSSPTVGSRWVDPRRVVDRQTPEEVAPSPRRPRGSARAPDRRGTARPARAGRAARSLRGRAGSRPPPSDRDEPIAGHGKRRRAEAVPVGDRADAAGRRRRRSRPGRPTARGSRPSGDGAPRPGDAAPGGAASASGIAVRSAVPRSQPVATSSSRARRATASPSRRRRGAVPRPRAPRPRRRPGRRLGRGPGSGCRGPC